MNNSIEGRASERRRFWTRRNFCVFLFSIALGAPVASAVTPDESNLITEGVLVAQADASTSSEAAPPATPTTPTTPTTQTATDSRPLEPRYQPREPEKESWYNNSYIFGMTRGLADSTIAPAGKAPLFLFTVPLDIVLLPFTIIGGLFG